MITKITDVYTRTYRDSGQTTTYVEWIGERGQIGRTEGQSDNQHMRALIERAEREGVPHRQESW